MQVGTELSALDRATLARLRRLLKRDQLTWREFLKRAIVSYELMYQPYQR